MLGSVLLAGVVGGVVGPGQITPDVSDESSLDQSCQPVSDDPLVVVGARHNAFEGAVHAINLTTGQTEWRWTTGDWVDTSPTAVNGTIYIGVTQPKFSSGVGAVFALNASSGDQQWKYDTNAVRSSPTVVNETVYAGTRNSRLHAIQRDEWYSTVGVDGSQRGRSVFSASHQRDCLYQCGRWYPPCTGSVLWEPTLESIGFE
ncbi:MAG: PQQ-binding-like beta-propeller repeat protein [Natrialbaceae archaeon]|nr:PQQ-binding-like beta-propeller repeat protein [Natrialbaceae archaeon]